jgi:hypothetical protein
MAAVAAVFDIKELAQRIGQCVLQPLRAVRLRDAHELDVVHARRRASGLYTLHLAARAAGVYVAQARHLSGLVHRIHRHWLQEHHRADQALEDRIYRMLDRRRDQLEAQLRVARAGRRRGLVQELLRAREAHYAHRRELIEAMEDDAVSDDGL